MLRHIRSFSKLTAEGVTLVGSEMEHILESVLPARFGGTPLDYQLMEEEDAGGLTRVVLIIAPRVGFVDEGAVIEAVLAALRGASLGTAVGGGLLGAAGALRVRRAEPIVTARGKLLPLASGAADAGRGITRRGSRRGHREGPACPRRRSCLRSAHGVGAPAGARGRRFHRRGRAAGESSAGA